MKKRYEQIIINDVKERVLQFRIIAKAVMIGLLWGIAGKSYAAYDFWANCSTGQRLYYKITDAENHYVSLVAPHSSDLYGWDGYTKPSGNIVFPDSVVYNGSNYTVTSIGNYAFRYCTGLIGNLNIPNTVTSIGNYFLSLQWLSIVVVVLLAIWF